MPALCRRTFEADARSTAVLHIPSVCCAQFRGTLILQMSVWPFAGIGYLDVVYVTVNDKALIDRPFGRIFHLKDEDNAGAVVLLGFLASHNMTLGQRRRAEELAFGPTISGMFKSELGSMLLHNFITEVWLVREIYDIATPPPPAALSDEDGVTTGKAAAIKRRGVLEDS